MAFMEKALVVYTKDQFALLEKVHTFALTHSIKLIDVPLDEFLETPGMVAIENDIHSAAARLLDTTISVQDNRVSCVAIAPKSVIQYLEFLFGSILRRRNQRKLPSCIGYIKTKRLTLTANRPMRLILDGRVRKTDHVELEMYPRAVRINMSDEYHDFHEPIDDNKDTMRVDNLPQNEERISMITRHLPLFTHALEEDFRELFLQVRNNAIAHPHYLALLILSS